MKRLLAVGLLVASTGLVTAQDCPDGTISDAQVQALIQTMIESGEVPTLGGDEFKRLIGEAESASPTTEAPSVKSGAPASADTSVALVDGASTTNLLGLALDNGLVNQKDGVMTVSLNAFAFRTITRPSVIDRQSQYEQYSRMRRWTGSLSLGGKGDAIDQDGDGQVDDPLEADSIDDIVTWELQYRFLGSRDRRDRQNFTQLERSVREAFGAVGQLRAQILQGIAGDLSAARDNATGCLSLEPVQTAIAREADLHLAPLVAAQDDLEDLLEGELSKIDESWVWSAFTRGTQRGSEFGGDKVAIGVRGARKGFTFNVEWERSDAMGGAVDDPESLRAALEHSWIWFQDTGLPGDGVEFSLSASFDRYRNVPGVMHDKVAKANMKFEFPVAKGITIPVSLTYANHKDLLTGEDEIRGHVGFSFDTSQLLKPKN